MKYHKSPNTIRVHIHDARVGDVLADDYDPGKKISRIERQPNGDFRVYHFDHNAEEHWDDFVEPCDILLERPLVRNTPVTTDADRYNAYLNLCRNQGRVAMEYCDWVKTIDKIHAKSNKPALADKFPHYYPELPAGTTHMDVYRVLDAFKVKRSSIQHAVKKLLAAGLRGAKDEVKDLKEARDSIDRALEMIREESPNAE